MAKNRKPVSKKALGPYYPPRPPHRPPVRPPRNAVVARLISMQAELDIRLGRIETILKSGGGPSGTVDLSAVTTKLTSIETKLDSLSTFTTALEKEMAVDFAAANAELANNTSLGGSIKQLITTLLAEVAAIPPSSDAATQAALDDLVSKWKANDDDVTAAVIAGTPAVAVAN